MFPPPIDPSWEPGDPRFPGRADTGRSACPDARGREPLERPPDGSDIWAGSGSTAGLDRKFGELTGYLLRAAVVLDGVVLATGTSLVPELAFTLADGDIVSIAIDGIGALVNPVVRGRLGQPV